MVEYGLALAMAASSIERSLKRFSDVDAASYARYTHLGQILRQFLEELDK